MNFIDYIEESCKNIEDNHISYIFKKKLLDEMTQRANEPTADISRMFYCQLGSISGEVFNRKAMAEELYKKLFKKIDENDEQITVKLNWWCLL